MSTAIMGSSTTPLASPRMPHSVGQSYPPVKSQLSPAVAADARTPSPNYFGLNIEPSGDIRDTNVMPRGNWSPPTSSVKSFAAALPKQLPLDANPEFEAFRRQADANHGKSFALGSSHFGHMPPPSVVRPKGPHRRPTNQNESTRHHDVGSTRMDVDSDSLHDSAYVSSESKRNSEASLSAPSLFDMPRHESPAQSDSPFQPLRRSNLSQVQDAHVRLSLPHNSIDTPATVSSQVRSETLPSNLETGPGLMMPEQLKSILEETPSNNVLLLDVRVSTHYAQSRIKGALNLCIPTTLLKRATFDLHKLQETLLFEEDQARFSKWKEAQYLVIYDASSCEKRDALPAMNMFKKFSSAGFAGQPYLLRGGFNSFGNAYPELIDRTSSSARAGVVSKTSSRPTFAPVIGGVALPTTAENPDPFFSNIRQNMDLADGVGQMAIAFPSSLDWMSLPGWLGEASAKADGGKKVSEKFLRIERAEQARMKDAYSSVKYGTPNASEADKVELSGIEKGTKNRYKDILPFEHSRVHLADRAQECDYINASYVHASRSNKRYIASQGPLPATFDDFWSVVWDQDTRVIVMLTAESEGGQLKCHPYWRGREYGAVRLKPLSEKKISLDMDKHRSNSTANPLSNSLAEYGRRRANTTTNVESSLPGPSALPTPSESPFVIVRKFALSHAAHPFAPIREITHLHYASWPDFGAPAQPSHLLALVELANVMQRAASPVDSDATQGTYTPDITATTGWSDEPEHNASARPMLVHCSAGCGRTGTFCTVDSVIDMLKRQRLHSSTRKRRHDDGDVQMDEPVSPRTFVARNGNARPSMTRDSSNASVDVSWLNDDSVDLIERTVEDFRGQRLSMVQSLRQFVLCYESVLEWIWRLDDRANGDIAPRSRARSGSLKARSSS